MPPVGTRNAFDPTERATDQNTTFGEFLREARVRRGLTLRQIAETTKLPLRHLEALERGDIEALPGGMYRRAELCAYAAAVGLDKNVALERLAGVSGSPEHRQPAHPAETTPPRDVWRRRHSMLSAAGSLVVAGSFTLMLWAVFQHRGGQLHIETSQRVSASAAPVPKAAPDLPIGTVGGHPVHQPAPQEPVPSDVQLVLLSEPPGARVTVNGIGWGVTPITIRYLPAEDLRVRMTKDGYASRERLVRIPANQAAVTVRITLDPRQ